ncbi:polyketide synthase PksN [Marininema halotolerans]|uniref:Polyketide synthase PksN n=1 Tax=Marininema halotolerans TaxID=1155944 RepID=A0A1I6PQG1_9BACL|nr:SDR family NAD(P)-dependent oxidoreductase [Marininema halotolerans]SFS42449.1 polyketide synthase PksN [Marininema halotolerans]
MLSETNEKNTGAQFQSYAVQVFEEVQRILHEKPKGKVLVQLVVPYQSDRWLYAALSALLKTTQLENPQFIGQVIEVNPEDRQQEIEAKLEENRHHPEDHWIRYENHRRYVAGWSEMEVSSPEEISIPWKDGGVYCIVGGVGGLGFLFAQEIARQVKEGVLLLIGRSPLDEEKKEKCKELEDRGVRVVYQQVDIRDEQAVVNFFTYAKEEFGGIHGMIHSAGVLHDNFIIKKTKEQFLDVLAPKVTGLIHLDQASREFDLDFFILFSSTAGSFGNVGQVDYATANAFMDAYAQHRNALVARNERKGRTLSINWPLWRGGGMGVDPEKEEWMEVQSGMVAMETASGIEALYRSLASGEDSVAVMEGNVERLHHNFVTHERSLKEETNHDIDGSKDKEDSFLYDKLLAFLKGMLSKVTKLPIERIRPKMNFQEVGMDSIMVMKLTNRLEETFGTLSKTLFFEYKNLDEVSNYLMEVHRKTIVDKWAAPDPIAIQLQEPASILQESTMTHPSNQVKEQPAKEKRVEHVRVEGGRNEAIAIIGLAGRYPGANNVREFWHNLSEGKDCITEIPSERWDSSQYTDSKWGGFLEGVDQFDPLFFHISPRDAELMDPQERLFLQCVYETIEDAGYTRDTLASYQGSGGQGSVGVYVGVMYEEYQLYGAEEQSKGQRIALSGNPSSVANRVSYFFDFHGPSMAIDTMCSSSLTAIHLACQSIQQGNCELAIAGGVNVSIHPNKYLALEQSKFASSKGRCESFGEGGDGYVPGEGVGAVLLKPLTQAIHDGDHIYGVIKESTINHGGKTNGYTVPNPNAQAEVIGRALNQSGTDPRRISYIEAHGTGTSLGDPIEITGLTKAFRSFTQDNGFCAIGSVKSNIGHGESSAGIAGLTKILLQLKHQKLAPSLHSKVLNAHIDFTSTPFVVQQELADWKRPILEHDGVTGEHPRLAGLSSFGAGGSNAHLLIEEYIGDLHNHPHSNGKPEVPFLLMVLSAKNREQLRAQAARLLEAIREGAITEEDLSAVAYTLQVGREAMEERLAMRVESIQEWVEKLQGFIDGDEPSEGIHVGQVKMHQDALHVFSDDEDMEQTINAWMKKGKYHKLLESWVRGLRIDWDGLYSNKKPGRISLPTYPFATKSYWISRSKKPVDHAIIVPPRTEENPSNKRGGISLTPLSAEGVSTEQGPSVNATLKSGRTLTSMNGKDTPRIRLSTNEGESVQEQRLPISVSAQHSHLQLLEKRNPRISLVEIQKTLTISLSEALYLEQSEIDLDQQFIDLGMDSIVGVEWLRDLNKTYGTSLVATVIYEYPSVREFARMLQKELDKIDAPPFNQMEATTDEVNMPFVEELPREDAYAKPCPPFEVNEQEERVSNEDGTQTDKSVPLNKKQAPAGTKRDVIAIVGMSGRYPGARNLDAYWDHLAQGHDAVGKIPKERWDVDQYYDPQPGKKGKMYCQSLGALEDIASFDPLFFNISPNEAEWIDPQQRIFLQEAYHAFEDAGYSPEALSNRKCGVYLGIMGNEYSRMAKESQGGVASTTGNSSAIAAARIAYFLNLKGPGISIDTACSSSLVATHLACQALINKEIDMGLIGGVTLYLTPDSYIDMCAANMLSHEGRCKSFDNQADGFVPGEGAGALVLKRLEDAEADHDTIYGLIVGSGINQDGKTNGITAPNIQSQIDLARGIYERYGIDAETISYAEMHGTGTKLGDPIELEALAKVFKEDTTAKQYCAIGSVKSNIGHTSAAAGVAGMQKILLSLQHQQLVPSIHYHQPNEHFNFSDSPFYVNTNLQTWQPTAANTPRRSCISSFGYSGTNAHLVIEEYQPQAGKEPGVPQINAEHPGLFVLSANSEDQLKLIALRMKNWLGSNTDVNLLDVAYTLQVGRAALDYRLALIATSLLDVHQQLTNFIEQRASTKQYIGKAKKSSAQLYELDEGASAQLQAWLQTKNLEKLAEVWTMGVAVDWQALYPHQKPYRMNLPTYPFAEEHHWLDQPLGEKNPTTTMIHPLLHQNLSDFLGFRFRSYLTERQTVLADHVINGKRVLSGAAQLEMVRAAFSQVVGRELGEAPIHVKNMAWYHPATPTEGQLQVDIGLSRNQDGTVTFEIYRPSNEKSREERRLYSKGTVALIEDEQEKNVLNLSSLQLACNQRVLSGHQCYEQFKRMKMEYGPSYQGIEQIYVGRGQVLAKLSLPSFVDTTEGYMLDPGMVDSALQASLGLADLDSDFSMSLPSSLDEVRMIGGTCPSSMWAWVRLDEESHGQDRTRKLHIDLCDERGLVQVQFRGLSVREVGQKEPQAFKHVQETNSSHRFYKKLVEQVERGELSAEDVGKLLRSGIVEEGRHA